MADTEHSRLIIEKLQWLKQTTGWVTRKADRPPQPNCASMPVNDQKQKARWLMGMCARLRSLFSSTCVTGLCFFYVTSRHNSDIPPLTLALCPLSVFQITIHVRRLRYKRRTSLRNTTSVHHVRTYARPSIRIPVCLQQISFWTLQIRFIAPSPHWLPPACMHSPRVYACLTFLYLKAGNAKGRESRHCVSANRVIILLSACAHTCALADVNGWMKKARTPQGLERNTHTRTEPHFRRTHSPLEKLDQQLQRSIRLFDWKVSRVCIWAHAGLNWGYWIGDLVISPPWGCSGGPVCYTTPLDPDSDQNTRECVCGGEPIWREVGVNQCKRALTWARSSSRSFSCPHFFHLFTLLCHH